MGERGQETLTWTWGGLLPYGKKKVPCMGAWTVCEKCGSRIGNCRSSRNRESVLVMQKALRAEGLASGWRYVRGGGCRGGRRRGGPSFERRCKSQRNPKVGSLKTVRGVGGGNQKG